MGLLYGLIIWAYYMGLLYELLIKKMKNNKFDIVIYFYYI